MSSFYHSSAQSELIALATKLTSPSQDAFDPKQRLPDLEDLVLSREGNLVTVQWRGSPKFSVGVLSALDDEQAFERAAVAMTQAVKPGFKEAEMKACAKEIRRRARAGSNAKPDASTSERSAVVGITAAV